ncbi:MAG: nicotinamide-nucleotide amidase [Gammaproteobacteria bacterium]|nr:nicotinamide-nucleotide amidase [Gammaproteobacteria bacterium]
MTNTPEAGLDALAATLGARLLAEGLVLATAESCTGGWVAQAVTAIAGSSAWFDRGFVTYSNEAKQELLGVPLATLEAHGAVSGATAAAMAQGVLAHSRADLSVSITGVAGPTGGSEAKPVGTVWFGFARKGGAVFTRHCLFAGDRRAIRASAVDFALRALLELAAGREPPSSG